jgi:hypothetical protein
MTTPKPQHTPGPWATDIDKAKELLRKGEDIDGATVYVNHGSGKGGEIATLRHDPDDQLNLIGDDEHEHTANARLIASAPELLAALQRLVDCPDVNLDDLELETLEAIDQANAAIQKAKGE